MSHFFETSGCLTGNVKRGYPFLVSLLQPPRTHLFTIICKRWRVVRENATKINFNLLLHHCYIMARGHLHSYKFPTSSSSYPPPQDHNICYCRFTSHWQWHSPLASIRASKIVWPDQFTIFMALAQAFIGVQEHITYGNKHLAHQWPCKWMLFVITPWSYCVISGNHPNCRRWLIQPITMSFNYLLTEQTTWTLLIKLMSQRWTSIMTTRRFLISQCFGEWQTTYIYICYWLIVWLYQFMHPHLSQPYMHVQSMDIIC